MEIEKPINIAFLFEKSELEELLLYYMEKLHYGLEWVLSNCSGKLKAKPKLTCLRQAHIHSHANNTKTVLFLSHVG